MRHFQAFYSIYWQNYQQKSGFGLSRFPRRYLIFSERLYFISMLIVRWWLKKEECNSLSVRPWIRNKWITFPMHRRRQSFIDHVYSYLNIFRSYIWNNCAYPLPPSYLESLKIIGMSQNKLIATFLDATWLRSLYLPILIIYPFQIATYLNARWLRSPDLPISYIYPSKLQLFWTRHG